MLNMTALEVAPLGVLANRKFFRSITKGLMLRSAIYPYMSIIRRTSYSPIYSREEELHPDRIGPRRKSQSYDLQHCRNRKSQQSEYLPVSGTAAFNDPAAHGRYRQKVHRCPSSMVKSCPAEMSEQKQIILIFQCATSLYVHPVPCRDAGTLMGGYSCLSAYRQSDF